jgi:hypothetical protein
MKYLIPVFLVIMIVFSSCEKDSNSTDQFTTIDSLAVPKDTCISKTYGNDNIVYCLDSIADSRCPANAVCVWAGVASAKFRVNINQVNHQVKLHTQTGMAIYPNDTTIAGFNFKLVDVTPYPVLPPVPATSKAIIKVIKL